MPRPLIIARLPRVWICLDRMTPTPRWAVRVGNTWLTATSIHITGVPLDTVLRPKGPQPKAYLAGYADAYVDLEKDCIFVRGRFGYQNAENIR